MIYNIGNCIVDLSSNDPLFMQYVTSEYSFLAVPTHSEKGSPEIVVKKSSSDHKRDCVLTLKSKFRETHILLNEQAITLSFPYHPNVLTFYAMINPLYQNRYEACLTDFFHNVFLGILQIRLLPMGKTLFHASSMIFPEKDRATVFFGAAQSGKTTLIGLMTDNHYGSIISEDFCIVSKDGNIFALPHQSRVKLEQYDKIKHGNTSIGEKLNRFICKLERQESLRRLPFKEIYSSQNICIESQIGVIHILQRGGTRIYTEECTENDFVSYCMQVLTNEFENFAGFRDMFEIMPCKKYAGYGWEEMISATRNKLSELYRSTHCDIIHVPMLESPSDAAKMLKKFLESL